MTATELEPVVIEIPEDAYKQNSVYRPWDDANSTATAKIYVICLTPHQLSKILASVGRELELADVVMSG